MGEQQSRSCAEWRGAEVAASLLRVEYRWHGDQRTVRAHRVRAPPASERERLRRRAQGRGADKTLCRRAAGPGIVTVLEGENITRSASRWATLPRTSPRPLIHVSPAIGHSHVVSSTHFAGRSGVRSSNRRTAAVLVPYV